MPTSVEIYVNGFRDVVTFQMLKPDPILGLVKPGLSVASIMGVVRGGNTDLPQTVESSGQTESIIVNMAVYIMAIVAFFSFLIVLFLLVRLKKYKPKIKEILIGIKEKTFWNNTIRSITISYIETAIQFKQKIQLLSLSSKMSDFGPIVGLGGFLISYPSICAYYTWKNRGIIHTKEEQKKTGKLYTGIALYRSYGAAFYYPVFMARRFLFVVIPIIFKGRPYLQIQFLVMFSSFYLVWFGTI